MAEGTKGFLDRIGGKIASVFAGAGTPVRVENKRLGKNSASFVVEGQSDLRPLGNADLHQVGKNVGSALSGDSGPVEASVVETAGKTRVITWKEDKSSSDSSSDQ